MGMERVLVLAKAAKLPLLAAENWSARLQFAAPANEISVAAATAAALFVFFYVRNARYFLAVDEKNNGTEKPFISGGRGCYSVS